MKLWRSKKNKQGENTAYPIGSEKPQRFKKNQQSGEQEPEAEVEPVPVALTNKDYTLEDKRGDPDFAEVQEDQDNEILRHQAQESFAAEGGKVFLDPSNSRFVAIDLKKRSGQGWAAGGLAGIAIGAAVEKHRNRGLAEKQEATSLEEAVEKGREIPYQDVEEIKVERNGRIRVETTGSRYGFRWKIPEEDVPRFIEAVKRSSLAPKLRVK